jgi:ketosteroid isomerase-like protein
MKTTKDVVENNIRCFREADIDGILDDFSPDAIVITPTALLRGRSEIQTLFRNLPGEFGKPGTSDDSSYVTGTELFLDGGVAQV